VCTWCVTSAILTVLIFVLATPWRALRPEASPGG